MAESNSPISTPFKEGRFATTHWTVILAAGSPDSSRYHQALETLCQTYWFPLYAYLRRQGYDAHQAEDYTQGFFATLLEKQGLRTADPKQGRFRSYLLGALKHFLSDQRDYERAQKRGGGRPALSLDLADAETRYAIEPGTTLSPEQLFEKSWALTLLDRTLARLRAEAIKAGNEQLFDHLKRSLTRNLDSVAHRTAAQQLGMTEGAVRTAVHRLRQRYRTILRDEIAQTVSSQDEIEAEIRDLFNAFAG